MTRRRFLRWLASAAAAGLMAGGYAFAVEPALRLRVQTWRIAPPRWPRGFRLRIAVLADLHAGAPHMSESRIAGIVARCNALAPDLTVLLGDFAAGHRFVTTPAPIERTAALLAELRAPLGVQAVLGNHDWWDDLDAQRRGAGPTRTHRALAAAGVPLLENQAIRLQHEGQPFWLVGLGDQLAFFDSLRARVGGPPRHFAPALSPSEGVDDLAGALAQVTDDAPAILLAHEPDIFPHVPARVALTLSGHTHGGQVSLLGWRPIVPSRYGQRYAYGVIEEDARMLVVSGGLGCSIAPIRFGVPPEITLIELA